MSPTRRPRAVTVDLDDTLFPQASWLDGAWRRVAAAAGERGLPVAPTLEALRTTAACGSDRGGIIDTAVAAVGGNPAVVPGLVRAFTGHAPTSLPLYPGAEAALRLLRASGVTVGVVTDGNPVIQRAKIDALGIPALVDTVVISDELGGRSMRKPNPAVFLEALRQLGTSPQDAVHIGDRPGKDCAGAAAAGLRCVRVRTGEYAGHPDGDHSPWRTADGVGAAVDLLLSPGCSG